MEHLWSPWRLAYITGANPTTGCVFCNALIDPAGDSLVVFRGHTCFVILNLYPYNNGHLMVIPNRHIASLASATADELRELIDLTRTAEIALTEAYAPHGLNMGINLGKPAGAGVLDHVHMHVVPRWNGDTNFMSVVGQTRVLAEELPETAARLRPIFQKAVDRGERCPRPALRSPLPGLRSPLSALRDHENAAAVTKLRADPVAGAPNHRRFARARNRHAPPSCTACSAPLRSLPPASFRRPRRTPIRGARP
jgi:ATP adenylyltransferase